MSSIPISLFTLGMVLWTICAVWVHRSDDRSVVMIAVATVPFFAVPGLSDPQYLPFEPNSPTVVGGLSILAAWLLIWLARSSWQLALPIWLCLVVVWGLIHMVAIVEPDAHALGLEVIFYAMLASVIAAKRSDLIGRFLPDPNDLREFVQWRVGRRD